MKLIGSLYCPFSYSAYITAKWLAIECDIEYINTDAKPDWFLKLSARGSVPILLEQDQCITESLVINEYLNDIADGVLYPNNRLLKAIHRSWLPFNGKLIGSFHKATLSHLKSDLDLGMTFTKNLLAMLENLDFLTEIINDENLCMLDIVYAPLFIMISAVESVFPIQPFNQFKKLTQWRKKLVNHQVIHAALPDNYQQLLLKRITMLNKDSIVSRAIQLESA